MNKLFRNNQLQARRFGLGISSFCNRSRLNGGCEEEDIEMLGSFDLFFGSSEKLER